MSVRVQFLGSGDAFGNGGRFQTCILFENAGKRLLIDCGASALIAMRRQDIDPGSIETILITHLHGDHFGGLPFYLLDARFGRRAHPRTAPLTIAGPPGIRERLDALCEVMFPGSTTLPHKFPLEVIELDLKGPNRIGDAEVTPFAAAHESGAPSLILRVAWGGRTVTYSGDTEWTEALIPAARDADLFIVECNFFDKAVKYHMDYATLSARFHELKAKRILLTHLGEDMLARVDNLAQPSARDGLVVEL